MEYYNLFFYVVLLIFVIGLLRAYRNKLKDRGETKDEKVDDKSKKDRQKSKKVPKTKDKPGVSFLRQRKNENSVTKGAIKEEKMGSFQSKSAKKFFKGDKKPSSNLNAAEHSSNKTPDSPSGCKSDENAAGISKVNKSVISANVMNDNSKIHQQKSSSFESVSNKNMILTDDKNTSIKHDRTLIDSEICKKTCVDETENISKHSKIKIENETIVTPGIMNELSEKNQRETQHVCQIDSEVQPIINFNDSVISKGDRDLEKSQNLINNFAEMFLDSFIHRTYNEAVSEMKISKIPTSVDDVQNRFFDKLVIDSDDVDKPNSKDISDIATSLSDNIIGDALSEFEPIDKKSYIICYADNLVNIIFNNTLSSNDYLISKDLSTQHVGNDYCDGTSRNLNMLVKCKSSPESNSKIALEISEPKEVINGTYFPCTPCIDDNTIDNIQADVVLRRNKSGSQRNNLAVNDNITKRYSGTDRPLSGYAEQLAELLAEEDVDFLDSDEELPDSLEKIRETFISKRNISVEVENIQRKCSRVELNAYGVKKFKSKIESKVYDKKNKFKGDRPLSLYEQDILGDILNNTEEEFDDNDEVEEDAISPVQTTVEFLDKNLPFTRDERTFSCSSSNCDSITDELNKSDSRVYDGKVRDIGQAAVIDLGCGILKAGMCGDLEPSCYCPSVIGVPRRFSQDISKMKKGFYVGDEAWSEAGMLQIEYPIKQHVTNWSDVGDIIEHLLEYELKVNDRNHPIMLTEMGLVPSKHREKLTEIMFERFGVPAFYLANQASLALYSMGLLTGVCLNSGFRCTQAVPVYEGCCIPHATLQMDIGGDHVTDYLGRILLESQGQKFSSSSEKLVLNSMKQSLCYVATDPRVENEEYRSTLKNLKNYTLPDGREIELNMERYLAPEILFDPNILGLNQPNTAELVRESVNLMDWSLQPQLKENILVTGGNTKLSGFGARLEKELSNFPEADLYRVKYADNPLLASWIGGSILSSIGTFRDQWITVDQYAEIGSRIVHKVCL